MPSNKTDETVVEKIDLNKISESITTNNIQLFENYKMLSEKITQLEKEYVEYKIENIREQYNIRDEFTKNLHEVMNVVNLIQVRTAFIITILSIVGSAVVSKVATIIFK